jgi:transposase
VLLHDNARLHTHTAAHTRALLEHFSWELFDHPLYNPDLAPSDYHLFTYLKSWLGSQCFNNNEELMEGVKIWLSSQAADFFDTVVQNIFPNMASASVLAVTKFRNSLRMCIFFCI